MRKFNLDLKRFRFDVKRFRFKIKKESLIKIWFSCFSLLFLLVVIGTTYTTNQMMDNYMTNILEGKSKIDGVSSYSLVEGKEYCYIAVDKPVIVLRMDDVRVSSYASEPIIDEVLSRNLSITLGIIPRDIRNEKATREYLKSIIDDPRIEIAQHGYQHNVNDANITEEDLLIGLREIQYYLRVRPVTYVPPFDQIYPEAVERVSDHFQTISGMGDIVTEGKALQIGYTFVTYDFQEARLESAEYGIRNCIEGIQKNNICVVELHPQELSTDIHNPIDLSEEKFDNFKQLLDGLEELNATFTTFHEIVECDGPSESIELTTEDSHLLKTENSYSETITNSASNIYNSFAIDRFILIIGIFIMVDLVIVLMFVLYIRKI